MNLIFVLLSTSLLFAQPKEEPNFVNVEAMGYIDSASKSASNDMSKADLFLYESSVKKDKYYPVIIKDKKLHDAAVKLKGQLVKIKGKLLFNKVTLGETNKKYTTIVAEDIQNIKLFDNFITDDAAYNKLYLPAEQSNTQSAKNSGGGGGVGLPGNTASVLIFLGGAALVGKIAHDLATWKNDGNKKK